MSSIHPPITVETDTSTRGWGPFSGKKGTNRRIMVSSGIQEAHQLAGTCEVSFGRGCHVCHIQINMDNVVDIAYINQMGDHPLSKIVSPGSNVWGLVYHEENHDPCRARASPRISQCDHRL